MKKTVAIIVSILLVSLMISCTHEQNGQSGEESQPAKSVLTPSETPTASAPSSLSADSFAGGETSASDPTALPTETSVDEPSTATPVAVPDPVDTDGGFVPSGEEGWGELKPIG